MLYKLVRLNLYIYMAGYLWKRHILQKQNWTLNCHINLTLWSNYFLKWIFIIITCITIDLDILLQVCDYCENVKEMLFDFFGHWWQKSAYLWVRIHVLFNVNGTHIKIFIRWDTPCTFCDVSTSILLQYSN